ncbi:cobyrinate a,c-diamide synthase [Halocynthiibacter sp. C4]|uniref:cobyrinate a,c-diamide synthase n=1 Tax=Halocynthiibacter sp. C4 TaxID=2992758 RepID=UPI00237A6867|nr:cobyrinate a,c-diamide synthase [Halocynthiibacter sp. C4]MDE0589720.1 cobyrinate a,c-diamide synthase [Halocynthiibacter sp. C4]
MTARGLLLAAPTSGAGKTTLTLGILRALADAGVSIRAAKSGPDYIDPAFHAAASRAPCGNLDAWAMSPEMLKAQATQHDNELLVVEGAMGLFDGAPPAGKGASADLARVLGLPVILIVDASKMAQSVAPLVAGFASYDAEVKIKGILLNKVGSPRHENMLRNALSPLNIPVLGALPRHTDLARPSRHLGLVQAGEHIDLEEFLSTAAQHIRSHVDLVALTGLAAPLPASGPLQQSRLTPDVQSIAVAQDAAFAFCYPHLLSEWRAAGKDIRFFSPLADDPVPESDLIYLPGGYPELHAATLSNATRFKLSMQAAAQRGTLIYGECGGYMTLGETLIDAEGVAHEMLGLLPLVTSFETRKLHLGYRDVEASSGPFTGAFKAHEFHYATTLKAEGTPLFTAKDAAGNALPAMGLINGNVSGSFAHLIAAP